MFLYRTRLENSARQHFYFRGTMDVPNANIPLPHKGRFQTVSFIWTNKNSNIF